jgi:hypothetical protein
MIEGSNHLFQQERASTARFIDGAPVLCGVTAIDTSPGKVDAHVALLQLRDPGARREAIPANHAPWRWAWAEAKDDDRVALCVVVARKYVTHAPTTAG